MSGTYKDNKVFKAEKQPRIQQKQRKNNYAQNLTRNVDMFLEEDNEGVEVEDNFDLFTADDTDDYPGDFCIPDGFNTNSEE